MRDREREKCREQWVGERTRGNEVGRRGGRCFLLHFIQEYTVDGRGGDAAQVNDVF